jgi:hypothetical protein
MTKWRPCSEELPVDEDLVVFANKWCEAVGKCRKTTGQDGDEGGELLVLSTKYQDHILHLLEGKRVEVD